MFLNIIEAVHGPIRGQVPFAPQEGNSSLNHKLESVCKQNEPDP
jgi:hypothetical protein